MTFESFTFDMLLLPAWALLVVVLVAASLRRMRSHSAPSVRRHVWRLGLLLVATGPVLIASLIESRLLPTGWLDFERLAPLWLTGVVSTWLWWRLDPPVSSSSLSSSTLGSSTRLELRDAGWLLAMACCGMAASGVRWRGMADQLSIVLAIDRSLSTRFVPDADERLRRELTAARTSMRPQDRLASVVFASQAQLEVPLLPSASWPEPSFPAPSGDATDLERALNKALLELPTEGAARVVLLSDGVATRGDTSRALARAVSARVPIDVLPLEQRAIANVRLLKLHAPSSVAQGETFDLRLVLEAPDDVEVILNLKEEGREQQQRRLAVERGQTVLGLRQLAERPGLHRLDVSVNSTEPALDLLPEDNHRTAFVRVRGQSTALVLTRATAPSPVEAALRQGGLLVQRSSAAGAPKTPEGFAAFDLLVLEDVPARDFTAPQLAAIAGCVQSGGVGLLMLGSPSAYAPGGYARSELEAISPVSFELKQDRRRAQLSQVLVLDSSGSMAARIEGQTKLALANEAALRSLALLNPEDRFGVMHVDRQVRWTLPLGEAARLRGVEPKLRSVGPAGGGIAVDPALQQAYAVLAKEPSALKHVLLFADGNDVEAAQDAARLAARALASRITTSVVALGVGVNAADLERLSDAGQGRFYAVQDARQLPAIFAQETLTAARSAVHEGPTQVIPESSSDILAGVDFEQSPALDGYVVTLAKPRAEMLLSGPERDPVLAIWSAGLGRVAAFTSDYGRKWGRPWLDWAGAAQLFAQLGRALSRNQDDSQVRLSVQAREGQIELTVDALDVDGTLDGLRTLGAQVADPGGDVESLPLHAVGPGRYSAVVPQDHVGTYLISVEDTQSGKLLATTGLSISALDELKPTGTDSSLLRQIAAQTNGRVRDTLAGLFNERSRDSTGVKDLSHVFAILAALAALASVAARRASLPRPLQRLWGSWSPSRLGSTLATPQANGSPHARVVSGMSPSNTPPDGDRPVTTEPTEGSAVERLLARRRERQRARKQ